MSKPINKLLVVDLSLLGDLLMTTPVLRSIHNAWPDCRMTYLARPHTGVVLDCNPLLEGVLRFESKEITLRNYLGAVRRIRSGRFDAALLIHRSFNSALVSFLAGVPRRIGYSWESRRLLLTDHLMEVREGHLVDRALRLLEPLGIEPSSRQLEYYSAPGASESLKAKAEGLGLNLEKPYLALNPAGSWPTKRWTAKGFAAVGDHFFAERGMQVVVTGGPDDSGVVGRVCGASREPVIDLQGKLSFDELYELLRGASLFVTNDSGPMHLGVAAGVPLVAVFGPTDPAVCGPVSTNSRVVRGDVGCHCCYLKECEHLSCMSSLLPKTVISAAESLLNPDGSK